MIMLKFEFTFDSERDVNIGTEIYKNLHFTLSLNTAAETSMHFPGICMLFPLKFRFLSYIVVSQVP